MTIMDPRYNIKEVEARIYEAWEKSGLFNPDVCVEKGFTRKDAEPFSVVLPPPNVTGTLHLGHAYEDTFQDIIVRFERMRGKRTLWVPGTDHAAIATQAKVEKELLKTEKKNRHDLGREEFLRRVNAFAKESRDTIVRQIRRMGASLDWSREAYTLDDERNLAVRTAFKEMYDLGLIYRGSRVVNWDPKGQTVISDDEVTHEERTAKMYTFRYEKDFPIAISTTRPETKVGDTAVAVHPSDERYKKFVGREFDVTFVGVPLHIKIIADESVEKDFGTGALGVTPAHSMADWEMAQKHKLPLVQVIDEYARMTIEGTLNGKKTLEARELIVAQLKEQGLIEKEEEATQNVSVSERTGGVIEPLPKLQWFVAVDKIFKSQFSIFNGIKKGQAVTLKELMKKAVTSGSVKILPERFEKSYLRWIENLRDWCISRQIWFGHRIPVWYCMSCGEPHVDMNIKSKWFLVRHGETDWNKEGRAQGSRSDTPLNDTGRTQAKEAGKALKNEKIDLVISSPQLRAKETAEIIARETGAEIMFDETLREMDYGDIERKYIHEITKEHGTFLIRPYKKLGGESFEEVEKRVKTALHAHRKAYEGKNVVITGHGVALALFLNHVNGKPFDGSPLPRIDNAKVVTLEIGNPCAKCGADMYEEDPDTFDTWFSSAMWTFSTLGWPSFAKASEGKPSHTPKKGELGPENDMANYHPTSFMGPGYEILYLWVARMILMSGCLLGETPFHTVALHGIVRDAKGQKFSKSLGNGVDPLVLAEQYGADAIRMALIVGTALGNDVKFDEQKVKGYRNFSTKIWNVARFVEMNKPAGDRRPPKTDRNHHHITKLETLKHEVTTYIEHIEFHLAAEKLYHYVWHTFADKIIEAEKERLKNGTDDEKAESYALLEHLLLESLKMLHPFMPFVTEEIYQIFKPGVMLMVEKW